MEKKLDEIEEGKDSFLHVMTEFYTPFMKELTEAEKNLEKVKLEQENEDSGEICESFAALKWYIKSVVTDVFSRVPIIPPAKTQNQLSWKPTGNARNAGKKCS